MQLVKYCGTINIQDDEKTIYHDTIAVLLSRHSTRAAHYPQLPERVDERRAQVYPAADRQPQDRVYLQRTGKNKPVPDAIRQIIGFYPIQMILGDNNDIYVECIHKTEHHLKGLVVDENNLPLPYAKVTYRFHSR